nr:MAG TPA: hypothetical protein [Bacteriophage sp.]
MATKEVNDDRIFTQLIHKSINEELYTAEASMRCNNKGWGCDYFNYITINPLYTEAW